MITPSPPAPRVVIVGAGFGGLSAAKALAHAPVDVTVIDRHNYHLFQPLLYQVATAGLSPADIASPIRSILSRQKNTKVILARVDGIDTRRREVKTSDDRLVPYDHLIIATGATDTYFGHDEWRHYAHGLKKIDDATLVRRKILLAFERAENEPDEALRRALLNFVVIGGGPTGVEMAGAIAELARTALAADFRVIDPQDARIVLIDAGTRLLANFDEELSEAAKRSLEKLGVEVRLDSLVGRCDATGVGFGDEFIEARTIIWAAGVRASPAAEWLGVETDRDGRIPVEPDLSVAGLPDVFVIGDTSRTLGRDGTPLPGVAPVAKQAGTYVGKLIRTRLEGGTAKPFRYKDVGSLATIGRKSAVVQFGSPKHRIRFTGYLAWWFWGIVHIFFLIGFRNRLAVAVDWAWNYVTFQRGTRLITGGDTLPTTNPG